MNRQAFDPASFTSRMTKGELIAALFYLPLHVWLLPLLLYSLPAAAGTSDLQDHFRYCLLQVLISYGMMIAFNLILNSILLLVLPAESPNPNNAAVMEMAGVEYGKTAALAIFLAPLVEEPVFRGAVFGGLYRYGRRLAYGASMLLFSLYHVWGYALLDPIYWVYLLQYLPVSWLLCRCYERCNSIWGSIFFHMTVNAVSISALNALSELLG